MMVHTRPYKRAQNKNHILNATVRGYRCGTGYGLVVMYLCMVGFQYGFKLGLGEWFLCGLVFGNGIIVGDGWFVCGRGLVQIYIGWFFNGRVFGVVSAQVYPGY